MKKNIVFLFVLLSVGSSLVAMDFNILGEVFDDILAEEATRKTDKVDVFVAGNSDNAKKFPCYKDFSICEPIKKDVHLRFTTEFYDVCHQWNRYEDIWVASKLYQWSSNGQVWLADFTSIRSVKHESVLSAERLGCSYNCSGCNYEYKQKNRRSELIAIVQCGHIFCKQCAQTGLQEWLINTMTCPACDAPLSFGDEKQ